MAGCSAEAWIGRISPGAVARAIAARHLLLVLDNCEHVIDATATLAEMFVRLCPRVTILATSREILRIQGEYVYRVPPLEVPATDEADAEHIWATARWSFSSREPKSWAPTSRRTPDEPADDRGDLSPPRRHTARHRICGGSRGNTGDRAGGRAVARSLRAANQRRRTAVPRHRTLRATLDWSYELLPDAERLLLRRLAIFSRQFLAGGG